MPAELKSLPILAIKEPALPVREAMDEVKLQELAENMKEIGLLQPIGVKELAECYEIEFGHRRYMAARMLGWTEIRCLVYRNGDLAVNAAMLAENLYREDITAAEEAAFMAQLMELHKLDTDGVAKMLHKSRDYVEQRIGLFQGDAAVYDALKRRVINFSVARAINLCGDPPMRAYFLDLAVRVGYTARAIAEMVNNWKSQQSVSTPATVTSDVIQPDVQPAVPEETCLLCGGNKDPYNMEYVKLHKHCKAHIEKVIQGVQQ